MATKKQLNLLYSTNVPIPFMPFDENGLNIVLVPSDKPIPPPTSIYADFEFELDYQDITWDLRFPEDSKEPWVKFFLPPDFVPEPPSLHIDIGVGTNPYSFSEYVRKTRANRKYIETTVTTRTWFWKQIGTTRNIYWCFYSADMAARTEYNYGTELLESLNEGVESMKRGRYIENQTGNGIVSGSWILKRTATVGCDMPQNIGNILIDGVEYSYGSIFGCD